MLRVFSEAAPDDRHVGRFPLPDPAGGEIRELIARSDALFNVIEKAKAVARSKLPVLIQGESGAGKELIARLIHEHSPRSKGKFVQINCSAVRALAASVRAAARRRSGAVDSES